MKLCIHFLLHLAGIMIRTRDLPITSLSDTALQRQEVRGRLGEAVISTTFRDVDTA